MNKIPDKYITFYYTFGRPPEDPGFCGYSSRINDPFIEDCEALITHNYVCTHCDVNAYKKKVVHFVEKYGHEKTILDGNTVLHYTAYHGDVPSIEYLLALGANKETKNDKGETARDVAKIDVWSYF